jgi:hypothetical protein
MQLTSWVSFFSTLASVTSTLAGLLFVSLSLNLNQLTRPEHRLTRRVAGMCFILYVYVIVISLSFLVPNVGTWSLALLLGSTGFLGLLDSARFAGQTRNACPEGEVKRYFQRRLNWAIADHLGLLSTAVGIYFGWPGAVHWLAAILMWMIVAATMRAWDLLIRLPDLSLKCE